jgi:tetratricopeptide (TPR) repeat protein
VTSPPVRRIICGLIPAILLVTRRNVAQRAPVDPTSSPAEGEAAAAREPEQAWAADLTRLALELEAQGALPAALEVCRQALDGAPQSAEVAGEMGRLALRLGRYEIAETALAAHLRLAPSAEGAIDLAQAQRGLRAFDRALATLTAALKADAVHARLWLTLAQLLCVQGQHAQAIVFFEEVLRLDPTAHAALDGLADALLLGGDADRAIDVSKAALATAPLGGGPRLKAAHARRLLTAGRLEPGWAAFARTYPGDAGEVEIRVAAPRWTPGEPLAGRLVLFGEADVATEILLANAIPDLVVHGPPLILAVHPSWVALARRSFPGAQVVERLARVEAGRPLQAANLDTPQLHGGALVGAWAPLRATIAGLRGHRAAFAGAAPYLTPDPQRVALRREQLALMGPGPKVGVLWRHASGDPDRAWEAPPLPALAAALARPDLCLIGIQDERILGELAWIRQTFGLPVQDPPPGFQPTDIDDVAALAQALDLVVGVPGAASYAAAASGARTWLLAPPRHWPLLGGATYPWFDTARVFSPTAPGDWSAALADLERALGELPAAGPEPR